MVFQSCRFFETLAAAVVVKKIPAKIMAEPVR